MMDAEQTRFIRDEIRRQMNVILNAESGQNDTQTETVNKLFPGMPGINSRPIMHPFGFVSRAAQGTISVIARIGDHFGNRMVIGHRDKNRPSDLAEGESAVYSVGGYTVKIANGKVQLGKGGTYETAVVGETLAELLGKMLDEILKHKHICSAPGAFGSPPDNAAQFTQQKADYVSNNKILAQDGGRF